MSRRPPRLVIELGRRRLRAVEAAPGGDAVQVHRAVDVEMPAELSFDDRAAMGAWLAATLDAAGMPRCPALLALPRDAVVARRLVLPTTESAEIPEMARLAMLRELPLDGGGAAIDHVEIARGDGATTIFGVAILQRTLDLLQECCTLAGRPPTVAAPRMLGTAALVEACGGADEPTLVVDVTGDGVEMLAVGGEPGIGFSRGATLRIDEERAASTPPGEPQPTEARSAVDAVVAEVKRSWLGHRMSSGPEGAAEVRRLLLIAERALGDAARPALAAATSLEARTIDVARVLRFTTQPRACAPLAGFMLAACQRVDLLHPRRPPDVAARRRQMAIGAAGLLVVAGLLGFTLGKREARATEDRREDISQKARGALAEGWRMRRDEDKLRHVAQWTEPREDWLQDFIYVKELLPEPGDVVLDTVAASQEFSGVKLEKPGATRSNAAQAAGPAAAAPGPAPGAPSPAASEGKPAADPAADAGRQPRWTSATDVRIVLEGEAKTRAIADALREKLITDSRFSVTTSGSDTRGGNRLPYPFGYLLRSQRTAGPIGDPASAAEAARPGEAKP